MIFVFEVHIKPHYTAGQYADAWVRAQHTRDERNCRIPDNQKHRPDRKQRKWRKKASMEFA